MAGRQLTPLESALTELRAAVAQVRPLPLPEPRSSARSPTRSIVSSTTMSCLGWRPSMRRSSRWWRLNRSGQVDAGELPGRSGGERSGVIRPTTRAPVLVHHSSDAAWFTDDRILPGLARSTGAQRIHERYSWWSTTRYRRAWQFWTHPTSTLWSQNRQLAAQLLAAADLWLFVTSAARYADAVPWGFLRAAADRSAAVAVVLDRVPPRAMTEVPPHLGQLMSERGLADSPLFAVPETTVRRSAACECDPADPGLAGSAGGGSGQPRQSRTPDARWCDRRAGGERPELARSVDEQLEVIEQLRAEVDRSYSEAVRTVQVQTADGTLLRGEVLARWHEFVGTGEFFRALEQKVSWLRDRVMATLKGEPPGAGNLKVAVESGLESLLREEAAAAERAELVAGQRRRPRPARGCRRRPVAVFARVRSEGGAGHSRLAGRCPGSGRRRGHEQALQGAVLCTRCQRGRCGVDDRRVRPHRWSGRGRDRGRRRHRGARPASPGGCLWGSGDSATGPDGQG